MKVKIILEFNPSDLEDSINKFLIQDCAVLIIYEEI